MKEILYILIGGTSLIGFTADIIAIYAFINTVRLKQYKDVPRKLLTILFVFAFSVGVYYLVRDPEILNLEGVLYVFSWVYFALSWLSIVVAATALKGAKEELTIYFAFASTALVSFVLGIIILFLVDKDAQVLGLCFFFASIIQILYVIGEYLLKRYLIAKKVSIGNGLLYEYPIALKQFAYELRSLPELFKQNPNLGVIINSSDEQSEEKMSSLDYKYWAYDVLFIIYTTTLGFILIYLDPDKVTNLIN